MINDSLSFPPPLSLAVYASCSEVLQGSLSLGARACASPSAIFLCGIFEMHQRRQKRKRTIVSTSFSPTSFNYSCGAIADERRPTGRRRGGSGKGRANSFRPLGRERDALHIDGSFAQFGSPFLF